MAGGQDGADDGSETSEEGEKTEGEIKMDKHGLALCHVPSQLVVRLEQDRKKLDARRCVKVNLGAKRFAQVPAGSLETDRGVALSRVGVPLGKEVAGDQAKSKRREGEVAGGRVQSTVGFSMVNPGGAHIFVLMPQSLQAINSRRGDGAKAVPRGEEVDDGGIEF